MAEQPISTSLMASASGDAQLSEDASLLVNIHIVSPSVGVDQPLDFSGLPVATTVGQLKAKIRETLSSSPPSDQQRLIHRGRLLAAENETFLDVFGEELIRSSDIQTLHLVLRDQPDQRSSSQPAPVRVTSRTEPPRPYPQASHIHAQPQSQPPGLQTDRQPPHPNLHPQQAPGFPGRGFAVPGLPGAVPQNPFTAPVAGFGAQQPRNAMQPHHLLTQQHQTMAQWMNQIQREVEHRGILNQHQREIEHRQILNQHQRERAAMGMNGVQDQPGSPQNAQPADGERGRSAAGMQQQGMRTIIREGVSPIGQRWRVTVNNTVFSGAPGTPSPLNPEAGAHGPRAPYSAAEVQNLLRSADANEATRTITDAIRRSASGASLASLGQNLGVTVPIIPRGSRSGSRRATPDPMAQRAMPAPSIAMQGSQIQASPGQPEVYILSSPRGPRALLINNNTEAYYTPTATSNDVQLPFGFHRPTFQTGSISGDGSAANTFPQTHPQQHDQLRQPPVEQAAQPVQQAPAPAPPAQDLEQIRAPMVIHPNNPGAGAVAAAIWPHLWLIVRLAAFVWWFTTPESSWTRWMTVISLAIAVFVMNTGMMNGFADGALGPFRRHLEGLIPMGGHQHARGAAPVPGTPNANPVHPPGEVAPSGDQRRGGVEPDPAEVAARLVAQRRNTNGSWLMAQVRRMERAGLLFLASIAPGVAEGHIAHLEAEIRSERERQEDDERRRREAEEEAAAAAAAAAAAGSEATENQEDKPQGDRPKEEDQNQDQDQAPNREDQAQNDRLAPPAPPEPPLIDI